LKALAQRDKFHSSLPFSAPLAHIIFSIIMHVVPEQKLESNAKNIQFIRLFPKQQQQQHNILDAKSSINP